MHPRLTGEESPCSNHGSMLSLPDAEDRGFPPARERKSQLLRESRFSLRFLSLVLLVAPDQAPESPPCAPGFPAELRLHGPCFAI